MAQHKLVFRNREGCVTRYVSVKKNETPSDRLLNLLLRKDVILEEGDVITVELDGVKDDKS